MSKIHNLDRRSFDLIQNIMSTQSIGEAAARLNVTSSALSHQLRELEQKLGSELIIRRKKPYLLTPMGALVADAAEQIMPLFSELETKIQRLKSGEVGRLHLSIECHSCYQWLMPTLDQFREQWPDIEVDIASGHLFEPLGALADLGLDLVITADPEPIPGLSFIPLFEYESVMLVPRRHRLADAGRICAEDLREETLIVYPVAPQKLDVFRKFLHPAGVEPKATRQIEITAVMMQLVAAGRGLTAIPSWAAVEYTDRGIVVPLRMNDGVFSTLYAAVREVDLQQAYLRDFLLLAKDTPLTTLRGVDKPKDS